MIKLEKAIKNRIYAFKMKNTMPVDTNALNNCYFVVEKYTTVIKNK